MSFTLRPIAATCALFTCAAACAQTTPAAQLDPVVVTATRIETPLADSIASVDVITRDDIETLQPASLGDLLKREAGLEMARTGGPGSVTSYFLRGSASTNVVILIDGARAPKDAWGNLLAVDIAPEEIERIEVLRGNASAFYGEGAIGGVIAITTRSAQQTNSTRIDLGLGNRGAKSANLAMMRQAGNVSFGIVAGHKLASGLSAMNTSIKTLANPDADAFTQDFARLSLRQNVSQDLSWGVSWAYAQSDIDYDNHQVGNPDWGTVSTSPADINTLKRTTQDFAADAKFALNPAWETELKLGKQFFKQHDRLNGAPTALNADLSSDQDTLAWSHKVVTDQGLMSFGLDMAWTSFENDGAMSTRTNRGGYLGWSNEWAALSSQLMLRRDEVRTNKPGTLQRWYHTSTMIGLGYDLNEAWRLTAAHSTGFQAPSVEYSANNEQLQPETHETLEAGIQFQQTHQRIRLVAFQNRTNNALVWLGRIPENIGKTSNKGLELTLNQTWGDTRLNANWVHQDPRDAGTQSLLLRRAKDYGSLGLTHRLNGADLGAQLHTSSKRNDVSSMVLAGYTTLDLTASKALTPEWTLRGKLENATDERYELAAGYNTPRRGVFVTLEYRAK